MYVEFDGIQLYRTSLHELNKNAIVEQMIKTLKQYLINIFMTYKLADLLSFYTGYKKHYVDTYNMDVSFTDYLLEISCTINNNKPHRTIKATLVNVFNELETNKQKINRVYYPFYKIGTIVIKKPESKGAFSNRLFDFDPEPYVIEEKRGRQYKLVKLIDLLEQKGVDEGGKFYQPYEIKSFLSGREFLSYLKSTLISKSLIRLYGLDRYNKIVNWFTTQVDQYTQLVK